MSTYRMFHGPTRRQFLGAVLAASGAALAARFGISRLAHAQAMQRDVQRRFIFCYFPGGWDQLLFLDPRDPEVYNEEARSRTLTDTRYEQLEGQNGFSSRLVRAGNLTFGPATEKPGTTVPKLTDHYDKIAIVRGMNMGTLGHEVGYRYFLTAKFPAGNSARGTSIATELAAQMNAQTALPVLALRVEAYNDRHPGRFNALRANSIDDLLLVLERGREYLERDTVEEALTEYARHGAPCEVNVYDRRGLLTQMREAQATSRDLLARELAQKFQFVTDPEVPSGADMATRQRIEAIRARNAAIRAQYGIAVGQADSLGARAALAALAIKEQIAQCVSVTIGNSTDTHFTNNLDHANKLYPGIAALAALIDDLARSDAPPELGGGKWLDHTTILAFSEFARTPLMNQFGGRDHHVASSCLLAGAGIVGNQVLGASGEVGMGPVRWDFRNHRISPDGENIKPEHIAATLLASAGLDYSVTRVEPLRPLLRSM